MLAFCLSRDSHILEEGLARQAGGESDLALVRPDEWRDNGLVDRSGPPDLHGLVEAALVGRDDAETQRAALAGLAPDRAGKLAMRLLAISLYRADGKRGRAEAERLGRALGMTQRGFYLLMSKADAFGPVLGLTPYQRQKPRRSVDRDGLHPRAEAALSGALSRGETRFGRIMSEVEAAMAGTQVDPPSRDTVRRRIAALGRSTAPRNVRLGRRIVVLQTVQAVDDRDDRAPLKAVTFVVDADLLLVLGLGVDVDAAESLRLALSACADRIVPGLAAARVPFAECVETVDMRLLPELDGRVRVDDALAGRTELDEEAFVQAFRPDAGQAVLRDGTAVALPMRAAWLPNAVAAWNARVLEGRPRARLDVDAGEALLSVVGALAARLGRRRAAAPQVTSASE